MHDVAFSSAMAACGYMTDGWAVARKEKYASND